MGKRLNDTNALVSCPSAHEHYSKSIRKIDNGYLTSIYSGGECSEMYSENHPDKGGGSDLDGGHGALRKAVEFMKK